MKLNQLKANQTELSFKNGDVLFFSYNTPVAALIAGSGSVRTTQKYSATTFKHINQWPEGVDAREASQATLNAMKEM